MGSSVVATILTVTGALLSFLAFKNVDVSFHKLQTESLQQLDYSVGLAWVANKVAARVAVVVSADQREALDTAKAMSFEQIGALDRTLQASRRVLTLNRKVLQQEREKSFVGISR